MFYLLSVFIYLVSVYDVSVIQKHTTVATRGAGIFELHNLPELLSYPVFIGVRHVM